MNQLISNVLMQPKPTDAVERPLTLVEKLEYKESEISKMMQADDAPFPYHYMAGKLNAIREIIDIVKQHTQPPNEVQEKIYQQEMDKINFCACGCILSAGLTQCSDCEEQDD